MGLFCEKCPTKIRHPMRLRHPVCHACYRKFLRQFDLDVEYTKKITNAGGAFCFRVRPCKTISRSFSRWSTSPTLVRFFFLLPPSAFPCLILFFWAETAFLSFLLGIGIFVESECCVRASGHHLPCLLLT